MTSIQQQKHDIKLVDLFLKGADLAEQEAREIAEDAEEAARKLDEQEEREAREIENDPQLDGLLAYDTFYGHEI